MNHDDDSDTDITTVMRMTMTIDHGQSDDRDGACDVRESTLQETAKILASGTDTQDHPFLQLRLLLTQCHYEME